MNLATTSIPARKTRLAGLALALIAVAGPLQATALAGNALEVHEWGTFTTLNSSAGMPLGGLYVDATRLPAFVNGLPYFNYDAAKGWASLEKLRGVTVKMETPVLYFYSQTEMAVDVKVGFQGGTISQWYPSCHECETDPTTASVDFAAAPYRGHIGWKATVLAPGTVLPYTTAASGLETPEWTAPRNTESNLIKGEKGEIEKFLFYRGLGNFPATVDIRFRPDGQLAVKNLGSDDIASLMVYERSYGPMYVSDAATIWYNGSMKAGGEIVLKRDKASTEYGQGFAAMETFRVELQKAGLTNSESRALLNTWYNGYFIEGGIKAFWIVPRAQVDRILPLTIVPEPGKLERVIVGRSEILTPEFEQALYHAEAVDSLEAKFGSDKYHMAFRDFLSKGSDWHLTTGIRSDRLAAAARATATWALPGGGWASPWFAKPGGRGAVDLQGRTLRNAPPLGR
ncbi:MAG: hypothetical protein ABIW76_23175 [Fibrobacteria bacterium]